MMLEDAKPSLLITTDEQRRASDLSVRTFSYNTCTGCGCEPLRLAKPEQTAYIIFTSGSTGRRKG